MDKLKLDIQRFAATPPTAGNLIDEECLYEYHQNIETNYAKKTDIPAETVLYNDASGTNGNVTLSSSAANYTYLEIFYRGNDSQYSSVKVYSPNGKDVSLLVSLGYNSRIYFKQKIVTISETSISNKNYSQGWFNGSNQQGWSNDNNIYITRVIGYY